MVRIQYFIIILLIICSFTTWAQTEKNTKPLPNKNGKITGLLVDTKNKPVAYATIAVFKDSTIVGGDLSKDDGSFSVENMGVGTFKLRITAIGYAQKMVKDVVLTDKNVKNVGKIVLTASEKTLKEVEVNGERPLMEMSVDKKTFNVEKNITTAGGSATDVLQNVPSVSVDVDGNVSLRGKGNVTILIDGKPSSLLGDDITSALQSLPAASIESVEVITNPGAKYDAQGVTGIINIITKRDKKFGFNGSVTAGAGTRDKYNGSLNLNMRNNKWNIFLNSSFRLNANYNDTRTNRSNTKYDSTHSGYDATQVDESYIRHFDGNFNSLGAEYTFDKHNSITLTENVNAMAFANGGNAHDRIYTPTWDTVSMRYANGRGAPTSSSTSLDYKHKFSKPKQELTANTTFSYTWFKRRQVYNTFDSLLAPTVNHDSIMEQSPVSGNIHSLNSQIDFTTPFLTENGKLELGVKSQLYWFESNTYDPLKYLHGGSSVGDVGIFDTVLYNAYEYTQQTHAAYASFSDQQGKFSYQAGLRVEDALYSGTIFKPKKVIDTTFQPNNLACLQLANLFPSVFFSYQLPKQQTVYINYTRRINRPGFRQLIPYKDVSNPQNITSGNPNLNPEFINNVELNYNKQFEKGHNLILSTYYQHTENLIVNPIHDSSNGITYTYPENAGYGITYGAELIGRAQIFPVWDVTVSSNIFKNHIYSDKITTVTNSGNGWFSKLNTNVKLPKGFSLQTNVNYESAKAVAQGTLKEAWWMDVAIRKNLWKNKANLVFNVSDIFNTRKYTTVYNLGTSSLPSYETIYRDRETRVGNISFTYRFGKTPDANKPDSGGGGHHKGGGGHHKDKTEGGEGKERDSNLKGDDKDDQPGDKPQGQGQGNQAPQGGSTTPAPQGGGSH